MFEVLMTKDYLVVALMALTAFLLLYFNPPVFQNKHYKAGGNSCPNASWHALLLLAVGTALYIFINKYSCSTN